VLLGAHPDNNQSRDIESLIPGEYLAMPLKAIERLNIPPLERTQGYSPRIVTL
jgi:hypothetical protein